MAPRCKPAPVPRVARSTVIPPFLDLSVQYRQDGAQVALHRLDGLRIQCRPGRRPEFTALLVLVDLLTRAIDRVLLGVQQLLHEHYQLDLPPLIDAVARSVLRGMEEFELTFPVPKHMRLQVGKRANVADGKELLNWLLPLHRSTSARSSRVIRAAIAL